VEVAKANGITLAQTFEREGKHVIHKTSLYGHASSYRRMRKVIKRQGTIAGRLSQEIARWSFYPLMVIPWQSTVRAGCRPNARRGIDTKDRLR